MKQDLSRQLGLFDSSSIIVGIVIGAGIFLLPNLIAQNVTSVAATLAVWGVSGLLSFFGALAYAELGAMLPETGGQYVYMRYAYGSLWAFLCGWTFFLVVLSGAIAWLAVTFSLYLSYFIHLSPLASKLVSLGLIAVLSLVNYRGLREGAFVQKLFTMLKIGGVLLIVGSAFLSSESAAAPQLSAQPGWSWSSFGAAMIACLMAYHGWTYISFVAGEVKRPEQNLPLSLALGMGVVIVLYLLANAAYMKVLPISEIAATERVGAVLAERTMGRLGAAAVSVTVLLSIIGSANGSIMTSARIPFAQARDGLFFRRFGAVHPQFGTPSFAIIAQAVWTAVLVLSGSYETLFSYSMFAAWIFYTMTIAAVPILRRKLPDVPRPYRMWGYPVTLCLFLAVSLWFLVNAVLTQPRPSAMALLIIATGLPAYRVWRRPKSSDREP